MKYIKTFILSFFCFIELLCFGQTKSDIIFQPVNEIKLDFFNSIPAVLDGCSGLYTYNTTSINKKKYILVTNLQELALIKINNTDISLTLVNESNPTKGIYKHTYQGKGYTIILTTHEIKKTGDETSLSAGTLIIIRGSSKLTIKIHGEEGC